MAFTATINAINPQGDASGNINFMVTVTFSDSVTGFTITKVYSFPPSTTQAQAVTQITADGTAFKATLATISNLSGKVGAVITI